MKKILIGLIILIAGTAVVFAQVSPPPISGVETIQPRSWSWSDIASWPNLILNWLFWGITGWTVVMVLLTAFDFVKSAGDPKKLGELSIRGRNIAIGIILAVLAKSIPAIIASIIRG